MKLTIENRSYGKPIAMEQLNRTIAWRKEQARKLKEKAQACTIEGKRNACPICDSRNFVAYTTINTFDYHECCECGHLFYLQIVKEAEVRAIYDGMTEYLDVYIDEDVFYTRIKMIAQPKVTYVTDAVRGIVGDEWLDIGCGGCELLYAAKKNGWAVRGIEAGASGVAQGRKFGIPVEQCFVTPSNIGKLIQSPKVVSFFDILEHISEPLPIVNAVVDAMPENAYFVVEVPRHPSLSALSIKLRPDLSVRQILPPDHIHVFSEQSLQILLTNAGLEISNIWTYGQDFYETISMLTTTANKEINTWPPELLMAMNDTQRALDKHGLSDTMLVISKKVK